jgi:hypothetical protein
MRALLRALHAESLKMRGTLALWMCLIAPAVVVVLYVLQMSFSRIPTRPAVDPAMAWKVFSQSVLALWLFLMLPLFVTLQSALLAGLEHGERQWKHLLALPVPRSVHYLAKLLMLAAMLAAAFALLLLLLPVGGLVLMWLKPQFGLAGAPDWLWLLATAARAYAAALLIVALQTWIAIRWRSFTVAVAVGMGATVAGFLIGQSERFGHWYPWTMPLQVMAGNGVHASFVVVAGLVGGGLVAALGLADFLRREVS